MKFFILLSFLSLSIIKHDIPIATYNLFVDDFEIKVEVEIHNADVEKLFNFINKQFSNEKFYYYLDKNSKWKINNQSVELEFCETELDKFHQKTTAHIFSKTKIKSIEIFNQSFINELEDFSNVYYIHQKNKKVRGFRSHKTRAIINVNL